MILSKLMRLILAELNSYEGTLLYVRYIDIVVDMTSPSFSVILHLYWPPPSSKSPTESVAGT